MPGLETTIRLAIVIAVLTAVQTAVAGF